MCQYANVPIGYACSYAMLKHRSETGTLAYWHIVPLFYLFCKRTTTFMLLGFEVFPLSLDFSVFFQLRVAFCKYKT